MNNFTNNTGPLSFMKAKDNTGAPTQQTVTMAINKTIIKKKQGLEQPNIIKVTQNNYDEEQIRNLLANS